MKDLSPQLSEAEDRLGYQFKNKKLLEQAFIHRSFYNEHRGTCPENTMSVSSS
jgi:dsRNA-specific ribonuclease